jgi:uncharacterized protein GlcG (DUF336 family)
VAGITLAQASTVVLAAIAKARETKCAPLAIAVLDAWGALGMGMGTRAFAKRVAEQPGQQAFFGALYAASEGRVFPAPGGVLIRDGAGTLLGAIGISGDVSDKDEACALAGITGAGLTGETG